MRLFQLEDFELVPLGTEGYPREEGNAPLVGPDDRPFPVGYATTRFAVQYVQGFLATGSFDEIPPKPCACQLEAEFVTGGAPFSVEERAASWRAWLPVSVLMKPAGVATERGWCS